MRVPSVRSPAEFNYLLNPLRHEKATLGLLSIEPHDFDSSNQPVIFFLIRFLCLLKQKTADNLRNHPL
jgi:hypothetical protein